MEIGAAHPPGAKTGTDLPAGGYSSTIDRDGSGETVDVGKGKPMNHGPDLNTTSGRRFEELGREMIQPAGKTI